MAGYATPAWNNGSSPALNAENMTAIGQAVELAEHPFGVCSTAAITVDKAVTIDFSGTLTLFTGLTVRVKFTNENTAPGPQLKVNDTAAKPIFINGIAAQSGAWQAGEVLTLTYDGTQWNAAKSYARQVFFNLYANSWTGSSAPYTQTVSVSGVTANNIGFLDISQSATASMRAIARDAMLYVTAQGSNSITVTADGDKPTDTIMCVLTLLS